MPTGLRADPFSSAEDCLVPVDGFYDVTRDLLRIKAPDASVLEPVR